MTTALSSLAEAPPSAPAPEDEIFVFPASFAQRRLWFLDQFEPGNAFYNIPAALRLPGMLNAQVLEHSLNEIVRRHEALRTTFASVDGKPVQVLAASKHLPLPVIDLRAVANREAEASRLAMEEAQRPFDLHRGPLIRSTLLRLADTDHVLLLTLHHIVADGWSMSVLFRELSALYEAFSAGRASPLPELPIQYADFSQWQLDLLQGETLQEHLTYWRQHLQDAPRLLSLPTDRPRPPVQVFRGATQLFSVPPSIAESLKTLSQQEGSTLFMTLLAAFNILLSRYSGQHDIVVGTPIANRTRAELEGLIGFFINTLVLRTDLSGEPSFRALLRRVRESTLGAYTHQDLPFERLVEELQPERTLSHNPLFQVMFILQNTPTMTAEAPSASAEPSPSQGSAPQVGTGTSKFDLILAIVESSSGLMGAIEYNTDLFDADRIARMTGHFQALLAAVAENADRRLSELPLLTAVEQQVLAQWNATAADYPQDRCVQELFSEQAARTPEAVAVSYGEHRLTYRELDERSNQLARYLRARGIGPEALVGLCVERSLDLVVGMLGILKAGGAYLPLEASYPKERLAFMLEDARVRLLLVHRDRLEKLPPFPGQVVCLDEVREEISRESTLPFPSGATSENLAYVIYTSGSTGRPKGSSILHRGICALFFNVDYIQIGASDRMAQASNASFDPSTFEIWGALLHGAQLVGVTRDPAREPQEFAAQIREERITVMFVTTAVLNLLAREQPGAFRTVHTLIFGGEAADPHALREVLRHGPPKRLINGYGPTECTVFSTWHHVATPPPLGVPVPIGRPVTHGRTYILDRHLRPVPIGVPGELYIGGERLGRDYFNRPDLTARTYIPDPFSEKPGARLYKTGDLARFLSDGRIEYLGRIDHQVKIRGYRVELGEIEEQLREHLAVKECTVVAREASGGDRRLAAYIVPRKREVPAGELRAFLRERLPEHMVPVSYTLMEALPLTPNGKVDRRALPAPETTRAEDDGSYVAPRTETEQMLARLWGELLQLDRVGIADNFFHLGGHSLLATQVISRVNEAFQVRLSLRRLFEVPTIEGLGALIEEARRAPPPPEQRVTALARAPRDGRLPLSFAQERLWFLEQLQPGNLAYNVPIAFRLSTAIDVGALERSLGEILRRHEALRTTFSSVDGQPVQVIAPPQPFVLPQVDLRHLPPQDRELEAQRWAQLEAQRPFDLVRGPLFRAQFLWLAAQDQVLLITLHHIVSDGWSLAVLMRELGALYEAFASHRPSPLPELPIQYADFAWWQRQWLQGEELERLLAYWRRQLAGAPPVLELPADRPRPPVQRFQGATQSFLLAPEVSQAIKALSLQEGSTLFMTLLTAFDVLLSRYSGQTDIIVGTPIANRTRPELEGLIGFFVNTLVLRTSLSGNPRFVDLLARVRDVTLEAYAHQDLPFERLVEELQPQRNLSHTPLFQVMFVLQNAPSSGSTSIQGSPPPQGALAPAAASSAKFDLTLSMVETEHGLIGSIEYNTDLFDPDRIIRLWDCFQVLLRGISADPFRRISELPLHSEQERHRLLVEENATRRGYSLERCLHEWIEDQVRRTPDAPAVLFEGTLLSYQELDRRATQVAHHLRRLGAGPESLVALCIERSLEMMVGVLGILKAGAAYVPIDPSYPEARLAFMLEDCGAPVLLTLERLRGGLPSYPGRVLCLDTDAPAISQEPETGLSRAATPDNLAYVIYTSGSTGRPKGAMNSHRGICNRLLWMQETYALGPEDRVLQKTPISFDVSVWELFWPLMTGACLVVARPEGHRDSRYLVDLIVEQGVTTVHFVPSMLQVFLEESGLERCVSLKRVICSGEQLPTALQDRFFARLDTQLHNLYGPTEAAVDVTAWACQRQYRRAAVPIGRPIANLAIYLLDERLEPVPVGVPGALYIGGVGVGRGYHRRPELTGERFMPDPFSSTPGARMYWTGDVACRLPDGNIEFIGRVDHQEKLRGFRIELGEIEAALRTHPAVQDVVVATRELTPGDKRLVAYVVPDSSRAFRVRQWARLQGAGLLARRDSHELPNGMVVVHLNRAETEFLYREIFEQDGYARHGITLKDGACVVDVGANIGLFTTFVASRCRGVKLYAFEPIPALHEVLALNAQLCSGTVKTFGFGLSNQEREATFSYYPHVSIISGYYADPETEQALVKTYERGRRETAGEDEALLDQVIEARVKAQPVVCQLRRLSDVIRQEEIERIDLLKIDVEKSERDVLEGIDKEDWARIRQVVVEVHDVGGRLEWVVQVLKEHGYEVAVDEETELQGTGLFTVYARQPSAPTLQGSPEQSTWSGPSQLIGDLREHLGRQLPEHMVPSLFMLMDTLPLSPSGKVDRRALPLPDVSLHASSAESVPPRNETEAALAEIWAQVLGIERVGVTDDFFALGGHSLLATRITSRIRDRFLVHFPLRRLFETPTIAGLAAAILEEQKAQGSAAPAPAQGIHRAEELDEESLLAKVGQLSDEEVSALLQQMAGARTEP
ncbi:MAG: amino acid adenylation domain-containing protein [Myxococcaceae bacterium]|nr:amino acid adenylation domain-containing protein [Myxococcaceae bacterium]